MKANELMIGDWVYCNYPSIKKNVRVDQIRRGGDDELKIVIVDVLPLVFTPEDIDPVPLTPEILKKNRWWKCNEDNEDGTTQYEMDEGNINYDLWLPSDKFPGLFGCRRRWEGLTQFYEMVNELPCSFVHQLQHALRLCGIEKEIEL